MADSDIPTLKSTLFTLQEVNSRYFNLDFDVRFRLPTIFAEYKLRNLHPFSANRVSSVVEFLWWISRALPDVVRKSGKLSKSGQCGNPTVIKKKKSKK